MTTPNDKKMEGRAEVAEQMGEFAVMVHTATGFLCIGAFDDKKSANNLAFYWNNLRPVNQDPEQQDVAGMAETIERLEAALARQEADNASSPNVIYRWRALDYSGFCYGSNPPHDLPSEACLTAFYRDPEGLRSALHEISATGNMTATDKQFSRHLQQIARDALAGAALARQEASVSAGDAVFAFASLLTALPHVVPFGSAAWATPAADLASAFNSANGLHVSVNFPDGLKFPKIEGDLLALVEQAAAPPAQVDLWRQELGLLATAIVSAGDQSPMTNGVFGEAERLLAVIDQQAGKGNDRAK